jgi:HAD superfamily hydrolase (TIGR01549 family)
VNIIDKKKFFIFDLDGVIFDSKKNMEFAWNITSKKFNLNIKFSSYFQKIGLPFLKILQNLNIEPDVKIYNCFKKNSLDKINKIKPYKGAIKLLKNFKKKGVKFSIVTSKDYKRSRFLLKKYNIQPVSIHCPNKMLRGKPSPDHLLFCLKKNKIKKKDACFIGDTHIDFQAAKKAKISFIFAKYGYGESKNIYKYKITKISDLKKVVFS